MRPPERAAIALMGLDSIARALRTGVARVKKASVRVALSAPISPGKYLVLVSGMEAGVEESWRAEVSDGAEAVVSTTCSSKALWSQYPMPSSSIIRAEQTYGKNEQKYDKSEQTYVKNEKKSPEKSGEGKIAPIAPAMPAYAASRLFMAICAGR